MKPMIHMNGTGRDDLTKQAWEAWRAVRDAQEALQGMAPNGRDYYPIGPDAFEEARREYEAMQDALRGVLEKIEALRDHIYQAGR